MKLPAYRNIVGAVATLIISAVTGASAQPLVYENRVGSSDGGMKDSLLYQVYVSQLPRPNQEFNLILRIMSRGVFDGKRRIEQNDLVSAKTEINLIIQDDNVDMRRFRFMNFYNMNSGRWEPVPIPSQTYQITEQVIGPALKFMLSFIPVVGSDLSFLQGVMSSSSSMSGTRTYSLEERNRIMEFEAEYDIIPISLDPIPGDEWDWGGYRNYHLGGYEFVMPVVAKTTDAEIHLNIGSVRTAPKNDAISGKIEFAKIYIPVRLNMLAEIRSGGPIRMTDASDRFTERSGSINIQTDFPAKIASLGAQLLINVPAGSSCRYSLETDSYDAMRSRTDNGSPYVWYVTSFKDGENTLYVACRNSRGGEGKLAIEFMVERPCNQLTLTECGQQSTRCTATAGKCADRAGNLNVGIAELRGNLGAGDSYIGYQGNEEYGNRLYEGIGAQLDQHGIYTFRVISGSGKISVFSVWRQGIAGFLELGRDSRLKDGKWDTNLKGTGYFHFIIAADEADISGDYIFTLTSPNSSQPVLSPLQRPWFVPKPVPDLVLGEETLPAATELLPNYPNPFNAETTIPFSIGIGESGGHVKLVIYNMLGQKVVTLVDEPRAAGNYSAKWDGTDSNGRHISSGIYFYQLQVGKSIELKKMLNVE